MNIFPRCALRLRTLRCAFASAIFLSLSTNGWAIGNLITTLTLDEPAGIARDNEVVRTGVPLPKGTLTNPAKIALLDSGEALPVQTRPLSLWDDGSVRWLLIDAHVDLAVGERKQLALHHDNTPVSVHSPLIVTEDGNAITLNTGPLMVEIPKDTGVIINRVWLDGALVIDEPTTETERGPYIRTNGEGFYGGFMTTSANDLFAPNDPMEDYKDYVESRALPLNLYDPWNLSVTVEEVGPLHAVVRISGPYMNTDGERFSNFIVRVHAYRGSAELRVEHTLVYTGAGGQDAIDAYGVRIPFAGAETIIEGVNNQAGSIIHTSYRTHSVIGSSRNGQALGYIGRANGSHNIGVILRDMAENFPKALTADASGINVELYPEASTAWDLARYSNTLDGDNGETSPSTNRGAQGLAKSDTFYLGFGTGSVAEETLVASAFAIDRGDLLMLANPDWYSNAKVMGIGDFTFDTDASELAVRIDKKLQITADWMRYNQRIQWDWFGLESYGDVRGYFDCQPPDVSECHWSGQGRYGWSGNSGEPLNQLWVQFLRTLNRDVFLDAEAFAKHTRDLQMVHYGNGQAANDASISSGRNEEFAVGSLHRHGVQPWSGYAKYPEYSHISGLETHYYLTGDMRARETLYEAGRFIHDYGSNSPEYTALVNGVDVLSRVSAIFFDEPALANTFESRLDYLISYIDGVNHEVNAIHNSFFSYAVRGALGMHYHYERSGDTRLRDAIVRAANEIEASPASFGANDDELYYYLNSLTFAASLVAPDSSEQQAYVAVIDEALLRNSHAFEINSGTSAFPIESFLNVPDDWTQWVWSWIPGVEIEPDAPSLLHIARDMHFRNSFLMDYHAYRAFLHLPPAMALLENLSTNVEPTADFDIASDKNVVGSTFQFTDHSNGYPTDWAWDFDNDGLMDANTPTAAHKFDDEGVYPVSLTVSNGAGESTITKTIEVIAGHVVIIDNDNANNTDGVFTLSGGSWQESSAADEYNNASIFSASAAPVAEWATPLVSGEYEVSIWIATNNNRTEDALFQVEHADGVADFHFDQDSRALASDGDPDTESGRWIVLGVFNFIDHGKVVLSRGSNDTAPLGADAVRFLSIEENGEETPPLPAPPPAATEVIVDNDNANNLPDHRFSVLEGDWSESSAAQEYLDSSVASTDPKARVRWSASLATGDYEVAVWIAADEARTGKSLFIVKHAEGNARFKLDQRQSVLESDGNPNVDAGKWITLGTFSFDSATDAKIIMKRYGAESTEPLGADAVRFQAVTAEPEPELEIIVDNNNDNNLPDYRFNVLEGDWSEASAAQEYLDSSVASTDPKARVRWSASLATGDYEVAVWIAADEARTGKSLFIVKHAEGNARFKLDQRQSMLESDGNPNIDAGKWITLGTFSFDSATNAKIIMKRYGAESTDPLGADAVRFRLN